MFDLLERRFLFSATVQIIDEVLTIVGTDVADNVQITHALERIGDDFVPLVRVQIDGGAIQEFPDELFHSVRIDAGDGDDVINARGALRPSFIRAGSGNDSVQGGGGFCTIYGDGGRDTLIGNVAPDLIVGGNGNDRLYGDRGSDTLKGQAGNDVLEGDVGHDTLRGGDGDDVLRGQQGNDRLDGDAGNDRLRGGSGNDLLIAVDPPGPFADNVNGGDHHDRARVDDDDLVTLIEEII